MRLVSQLVLFVGLLREIMTLLMIMFQLMIANDTVIIMNIMTGFELFLMALLPLNV